MFVYFSLASNFCVGKLESHESRFCVQKTSTMSRKKGRIGAEGSANTCPQETPTGQGTMSCHHHLEGKPQVQHIFQVCYEVCIPDIDDHDKFGIVSMNFKVTKSYSVPFNNEAQQNNHPERDDIALNQRCSHIKENNAASHIVCGATEKDIAELPAELKLMMKDQPPRILHLTL